MSGPAVIPAASPATAAGYDVLTLGRVSVDLYPTDVGGRLDEVKRFGKYLGGSPTNVAVAAARLGRRAAVITRTGDDPFGRFVRSSLHRFCVDDRFVTPVPDLPTAVTFCEMFPPDDFPLWMYDAQRAPYFRILPEELDLGAIRTAGIYWSTATGLSRQPSRRSHFAAWQARGRSRTSVLDLDYRPAGCGGRHDRSCRPAETAGGGPGPARRGRSGRHC